MRQLIFKILSIFKLTMIVDYDSAYNGLIGPNFKFGVAS